MGSPPWIATIGCGNNSDLPSREPGCFARLQLRLNGVIILQIEDRNPIERFPNTKED